MRIQTRVWLAAWLVTYSGLAGCAMRPLSTPESVPSSTCPQDIGEIRLFGFREKDPKLADRVGALFQRAGTVSHSELDAFFDERETTGLDLALLDTYQQV